MLREPRRLIASLIAVVVGVAFASATLVLFASLKESLDGFSAGAATDSAAVVQEGSGQKITPAVADEIRRLPGVTGVQGQAVTLVTQRYQGAGLNLLLTTMPRLGKSATLVDGRAPSTGGEAAVNTTLAKLQNLKVGSVIELGPTALGPSGQLRVVGVVETAPEIDGGSPYAYAADQVVFQYAESDGYNEAFVFSDRPQSEVKAAVQALPSVASARLTVRTTAEYVKAERAANAEAMSTITAFFLGFAVVALVVAGLVISNTFSILVAQRTRQLALMRCVGATRGQVFRQVLGEAATLGLVAGGVGVLSGVGLAYGLVRLSRVLGGTSVITAFTVPVAAVVVPLVVGLTVTVVAALMPARRATRVAPLAALRPQLEASVTPAGVVRVVLGALLAAAGTAGLLYGAVKPGLTKDNGTGYVVIGVAGGLLAFVGVMLLARLLVPALARVVGLVPTLLGGVAGRLATENSRRNPARAAATASALVIGVTLVSMTFVGVETGRRSYSDGLDLKYPADLTIQPAQNQVPNEMVEKTTRSPDVAGVVRVDQADVKVNGTMTYVTGVGPEAWSVLRSTRSIEGLTDSTILVTKKSGIAHGTKVTLTGSSGQVTLTAVVNSRQPERPVVTLASLSKVVDIRQEALWVRVVDGRDAREVTQNLGTTLSDYRVYISGGAEARAQFATVTNVLLLVINGLLGISILIALIGITNTLGLSVLERTQESGLLRALGLTRGRLRWVFSLEALTLAGVASLLGAALGTGFGVAGAYALLKGVVEVVVVIPWGTLALVMLGGLLSGLVASWVPAVRAGRIQPAAALTYE